MKDDQKIQALKGVLAQLDPESEEAKALRARIALEQAVQDRKLRRLTSPYEPVRLKLMHIGDARKNFRGFGIRVQFNQRYTGTLLLDTGGSGISLSPKAVQKAGLEAVGGQSYDVKGIGDNKPQDALHYLAAEVRIGSVAFADHPIDVFSAAKDSDVDGLIGSDVFSMFLIHLDFPAGELYLEPFHDRPGDEPEDPLPPAEGFHRVLSWGNHLMVPTSINQGPAKLFLIDSGSSTNLIDAEAARQFTKVHQDERLNVRGIQGKVGQVARADKISLVFAGFRQDNPDLIAIALENVGDSSGIGITGVIGMPVLAQLRVTIENRSGALRLER